MSTRVTVPVIIGNCCILIDWGILSILFRTGLLLQMSESASEVEIKTADFLFQYKQRDNFYICLLIEFWRFLNFRSEPRLKRRLATSVGAMRKLRNNRSPATS